MRIRIVALFMAVLLVTTMTVVCTSQGNNESAWWLTPHRIVQTNLREIKSVKKDYPDHAVVVSLMVPCEEAEWAAILPLVKKEGMPEIARDIVKRFLAEGIHTRYDEQHAIGRRLRCGAGGEDRSGR